MEPARASRSASETAEAPVLSAGQVARRLGVATTTVRTWDRRYGVGPSRREAGRHRRYSEADTARVALMARLIRQGVRAREAAQVASVASPDLQRGEPSGSTLPPGAKALPVADRSDAARGLWRAALALDEVEMDRILRDAVGAGVPGAWSDVIGPAFRHIERRHVATGRCVDAEHLLSRAVSAALSRVERPPVPARILLACGPNELHTLALEALAAALAEQGRASRCLGARVPLPAWRDALARTGPRAAVVWAQTPETADAALLEAARAARPRPSLVMAAGPGWIPELLPTGVALPPDLTGALALLEGLP